MMVAQAALLSAAEPGPAAVPAADSAPGGRYDLLVYGATPGGIACAVRAAREGLTVLLVNHTDHLGGMPTNGLGVWDTLYDGRRCPVYDEIRERIENHYRDKFGPDSPQLKAARPGPRTMSSPRGYFEPHVAERVFEGIVAAEPRITVLRSLVPVSFEQDGRLLTSVEFEPRKGGPSRRVAAAMFADGSYEGDLMAAAKAPYRIGREARDEYDEPHAGVVFGNYIGSENELAKFPRDAIEGRLNLRGFRITKGRVHEGSTGAGDDAVQAYNFRICLTNDPKNIVLPEKPATYRREDFLNKSKWLGSAGSINGKGSWNEPKLPGENHAYPDGDWATRDAITRRHLDHALGWIYFMQNDESIPLKQREMNRRVGLPKDEFIDNGHVPYEMYVREARRLVGRAVFTEHDGLLAPGLERAPIHWDSIAVTEWPMDSHECTAKHGPKGGSDGSVLLTEETRPGQVAYRTLLPPEIDNLLVPVCLSSTHVGWGAIRLEPTWMNTGESAGYAAAQAVADRCSPADIDISRLQRTLAEKGVMISFFNDVDLAAGESWTAAGQYLGTRGFFRSYDARPADPLTAATARLWATFTAAWTSDTAADATALARQLPQREAATEPAVTAAEFLGLVREALAADGSSTEATDDLLTALAIPPAEPISRGAACQVVYRVLEAANLVP
jgi:hypothetical protein